MKRFIPAIAVLVLAGCGSKVSGTYSGKDTGFFDKLTFKSGGKVEITFMGSTVEGTYKVEGDKVKVTNAGQTQVLALADGGCIEGGALIGKYCKE